MTTRDDLDQMLDALEARLPALLAEHPDEGDFWAAFAGEADYVGDLAPAESCQHVQDRLAQMLAKHGRYLIQISEDRSNLGGVQIAP